MRPNAKKEPQDSKQTPIVISDAAETFRTAFLQTQAVASQLNTSRERLIAYAKANPGSFKGNSLSLANGTTVRKQLRVSSKFNDDLIDPDWIQQFLCTKSARAISVNIDPKKIDQSDPEVTKLLEQIRYSTEQTYAWCVCVTSNTPLEPDE